MGSTLSRGKDSKHLGKPHFHAQHSLGIRWTSACREPRGTQIVGQKRERRTNRYHTDAVLESLAGEGGGAVYSLPVVVWPPAGTVDVDVLGLKAEGLGLHHVGDVAVQHAHTYARRTCSARSPTVPRDPVPSCCLVPSDR